MELIPVFQILKLIEHLFLLHFFWSSISIIHLSLMELIIQYFVFSNPIIINFLYSIPFFLCLLLHFFFVFYTFRISLPFLLLIWNFMSSLHHFNILINLIFPFRCILIALFKSFYHWYYLLWCKCNQCLCLWILLLGLQE